MPDFTDVHAKRRPQKVTIVLCHSALQHAIVRIPPQRPSVRSWVLSPTSQSRAVADYQQGKGSSCPGAGLPPVTNCHSLPTSRTNQ